MPMAAVYAAMPEAIWLSIFLGVFAGVAAGALIGAFNGIGVSVFGVSPFMMTLGMSSVGFGIALYMTGGTPVYGMPVEFGDLFGFGHFLGIPMPVLVAIWMILAAYVLINWTRPGALLLCGWRQYQSRITLRYQYAPDVVPGISDMRSHSGDFGDAFNGKAGYGRGKHRCRNAARVDCCMRDRRC